MLRLRYRLWSYHGGGGVGSPTGLDERGGLDLVEFRDPGSSAVGGSFRGSHGSVGEGWYGIASDCLIDLQKERGTVALQYVLPVTSPVSLLTRTSFTTHSVQYIQYTLSVHLTLF